MDQASVYKYTIICFYLLIGAVEAKSNWTGYFQGDYSSSDSPGRDRGFQLRRINLIFNRPISKRARAFADIEYEDGAELSGSGGKGEIKISRGFAEFRLSSELKVAAGKFLTPYGYYNEIHDFSASYIPIDPPSLIYGKNAIFAGLGTKRLISKYSTGLRFLYTKEKLNLKAGVANGGIQTSNGTDANKSPMYFLKAEYQILDDSSISLSYLKDKVNTLHLPKWEEHANATLNIELLKYFLVSEFGIGYTRNQSGINGQSYLNHSHLVGLYLGGSFATYFNYQSLLPDRQNSQRRIDNFSIGLNYHYNYFTIFKAELQKQTQKEINGQNDYYTQQLSISMLF